jgi:hypothetical protein|tara:strand:+ start:26 stop:160 length:135 start_codon:yes stop_codon:yes gene_type:complete
MNVLIVIGFVSEKGKSKYYWQESAVSPILALQIKLLIVLETPIL